MKPTNENLHLQKKLREQGEKIWNVVSILFFCLLREEEKVDDFMKNKGSVQKEK